ncbi:MAG TPA: hypothetical protein PK514_07505 [Spirochaetota bacterium]|nr:hypothetical protein [Spirochaetota bacterium]
MRRAVAGIFFFLLILNGPGSLPAQNTGIYDWSDSLKQFETVSSLVLDNPVSPDLKEYTQLLVSLAPAAGRNNVFKLLDAALKKLEDAGAAGSASWLILAAAVIEAGYPERLKDSGAFLDKWLVSGTWKRYGPADMDYPFQPEESPDWKKIKVKKISQVSTGFFPYSAASGDAGVLYARCSFAVNSGVRIAVLSDAECRVFINGKDSGRCRDLSGRFGAAFRLTGSGGYTVMLKFAADGRDLPSTSVFVAGEKGDLPGFRITENVKRTPATVEDLLIDYKNEKYEEGGEAVTSIRALVADSDYHGALDLCEEMIEKNPRNFFIYREYTALLDLMQRDSEFINLIEKFRNTFPESDITQAWLARFYSTRDKEKFIESMGASDPFNTDFYLAVNYVHAVGVKGDHEKAVTEAEKFIQSPPEKFITVAEMYSAAGKREEMRKVLVHGAAETGDARIFYMLGCADEASGLDPVIYWTKSLESEDIFCEASDMIDAYENSNPGTNIYYTGSYSGVREEFRNNGIRRRINIRFFESGKVYTEVEDFIPSAIIKKGKGESFSYVLPSMKDARVLYALKVNDDLTEPAEYTESRDGKRTGVEIKNCGDCRYAVVKYSCCIDSSGRIELTAAGIPAIMKDEFVEDIRINILYTGTGKPGVLINNQPVRGRERISESIFSWNDMFSRSPDETLFVIINMFRTPEDFASWYSGLAAIRGRFSDNTVFLFPEHVDTASALGYIKREVFSGLDNPESSGLLPGTPESVMRLKVASPVEKAFLALAMLQRAGIKGNIAFGLSPDGTSVDENEVLVYVRVNDQEWYWLPVSGNLTARDTEGERKAVVVLENGGRIMPVETGRVIKE